MSVNTSVADRSPGAVGLKVTRTVQVAPGARNPMQSVPTIVKSPGLVPAKVTSVIWNGEGHTAYPQTVCIQRAVDTYLTTLDPPANGLVCPAS